MTGKELKKILDAMTEEELAMEVAFDGETCYTTEGEEVFIPQLDNVDDEFENKIVVIDDDGEVTLQNK